jgi:hypothetical protein
LSRGRKAIVVSVCEENTRKLTKLLEAQGAKVRRIRKEHLEILGGFGGWWMSTVLKALEWHPSIIFHFFRISLKVATNFVL